ncbi:hypothetical protein EIN_229640 [Entamoeba invadens IP1]|uniref:F-box domain-containing protein n=1 Tax=Entamoeba invadens IP1 TaxID=370355 RepID=A0A0A1U2Z0_ENTIV|nr:hypothetical protein EIN_229640 [Entamoeba invadens IP1]ELP88431.1 hypothetical protein EIN_229640 [Entamoeba invadens IP1]|eukprot:XP_004255202.1 hypothetical protein EIN_229640 [Entamoeba invadens IP1]
MATLSVLYLCQVFSYVETETLRIAIFINKKCYKVLQHTLQTLTNDINLPKIVHSCSSLCIVPTRINGDVSNSTFTKFDYKTLEHIKNDINVRTLIFSFDATTDYHFFSTVMNLIPLNRLNRLEFGTCDVGSDCIKMSAQKISKTQNCLKELNFWRDPGLLGRNSSQNEIEAISKLTQLEVMRCFAWSNTFTSLVNISSLNLHFKDDFNRFVDDFVTLKNLRILTVRSQNLKTYVSISRVVEITQLTTLDIVRTQIVKDPEILRLSACTNLKNVIVYMIESVSDEVSRLYQFFPQFSFQLQLYSVPLDGHKFPKFKETNESPSPKNLTPFHLTLFQREFTPKFARTFFNKFKQWPPNLYFKSYNIFNLSTLSRGKGLAETLMRLELHFITNLQNINSVNSFLFLTALSIRHCSIQQTEIIELTNLHFLKRFGVTDSNVIDLIQLSCLTSLTSFTLKNEEHFTNLLHHFALLPNLKQICLNNITTVEMEDVVSLAELTQIKHFTFDRNSIFENNHKLFATPFRTVAFVTPQ